MVRTFPWLVYSSIGVSGSSIVVAVVVVLIASGWVVGIVIIASNTVASVHHGVILVVGLARRGAGMMWDGRWGGLMCGVTSSLTLHLPQ